MDLATILKAIALVGDLTPAAMSLYEGFIEATDGETQADLKARYAAARNASDTLHEQLQERFTA